MVNDLIKELCKKEGIESNKLPNDTGALSPIEGKCPSCEKSMLLFRCEKLELKNECRQCGHTFTLPKL